MLHDATQFAFPGRVLTDPTGKFSLKQSKIVDLIKILSLGGKNKNFMRISNRMNLNKSSF